MTPSTRAHDRPRDSTTNTVAGSVRWLALCLLIIAGLSLGNAPAQIDDEETPAPTASPAASPTPSNTISTSSNEPPAPEDPFVSELEKLRRDYAATLRAGQGIDQQLEALRQLVRDVRDFENELLTDQLAAAADIDALLGRRTTGVAASAPISQAVRLVMLLIGAMVLRTLWKIRSSRLRAERRAVREAAALGASASADKSGGPPYATSPFATPAHGTPVHISSGAWGGIALVAFVFISALIVALLWEPTVIFGSSESADIERVRELNERLLELRSDATRLVEQMETVIVESQRTRDLVLNVQSRLDEFAERSAGLLDDTPSTPRGRWRPLTIILLIGSVIAVVGGVAIWQAARRVRRKARVAMRKRNAGRSSKPGSLRATTTSRKGTSGKNRPSRDYDPSLDD